MEKTGWKYLDCKPHKPAEEKGKRTALLRLPVSDDLFNKYKRAIEIIRSKKIPIYNYLTACFIRFRRD
jgi:hypothetical protein